MNKQENKRKNTHSINTLCTIIVFHIAFLPWNVSRETVFHKLSFVAEGKKEWCWKVWWDEWAQFKIRNIFCESPFPHVSTSLSVSWPWPSSLRMTPCQFCHLSCLQFCDLMRPPSWIFIRMLYCLSHSSSAWLLLIIVCTHSVPWSGILCPRSGQCSVNHCPV